MLAATSGAEVWTAAAAWVTVGIYVAVAFFAWRQLRDARETREETTRPYVFVDFDLDTDPPMIYLAVQNTGQTAASDVHFECDPPMTSSLDQPGRAHATLLGDWPHLPPNKTIRSVFDSGIERFGDGATLPMAYTVTVTYNSERTGKPYKSVIRLDLSRYRNLSYEPRTKLKDVVGSVQELTQAIKGGDGLHVVARDYNEWTDERNKVRAEAIRRHEELKARLASQQTPEAPQERPATPERRPRKVAAKKAAAPRQKAAERST